MRGCGYWEGGASVKVEGGKMELVGSMELEGGATNNSVWLNYCSSTSMSSL